MRRLVVAAAALPVIAACASGAARDRPPGPPPAAPLFVSPVGEPFRPSRPGGGLAAWLTRADTNGDGRLTTAEMASDADRFFAVLDSDGDGRIDPRENGRYEREIAPEITGERGAAGGPDIEAVDGARPRPPGGGRGPGGRGGPPDASERGRGPGGGAPEQALMGAAPFGVTGEPQPVRAADTDLSQSVSKAEFQAHAAQLFERLDVNHDGALTVAELGPQMRFATRGRGQGGRVREGGRRGGGPR